MGLNKKSVFFSKYWGLLILLLTAWGCAVQQKPQGGPKDVTPPKLLKATPANLTRNFSAKQIQLDFDEYFRLNNQFQEITIFPAPDKRPDFKIKQKSLIITLKDTLQKNTTYVINFGAGIADVTEGNKMKNFSYVFSTGPHIDSLSLSGSVTDMFTQQKAQNATVMLFSLKQDSLLFGKKKPTIYSTTDTAGHFSLNNLKEGDYKIYALQEKNPDKIYNDDNESIAFSKNTIHLRRDSSGIKLNLFKQIPQKLRLTERKFNTDGSLYFVFNKRLNNPSVHILYPSDLDAQKIVDINKTHDTISVYSKNMDFDSVRLAFYENNKPVDTTYLRKGRKESYTRLLLLNYGLSRNQTVLKPATDLGLTADMPIESFDPALVSLKEDTAYVNFTIVKDSSTTQKYFTLKYRWQPKSEYTLTLNEGAFTSIYGDKNKKQTKRFTIDKQDNYSSFALTFNVPDTSKSYLVELLNEQKMILRTDYITKKTTITYKDYYTGKYFVQVVYDDNRNGKWDTGSVKQKSQPEKQAENIWLDNKEFTTKPKWTLNETIDIPPETINP